MKDCILKAHTEGRMALIPFITAGFPSMEKFWDCLADIDAAGVDIIELGVPFSDPVADGPVIEAASRKALADGVSLKWLLDGLLARKGQYHAKLVLMGYTNPFLQYGLEKLAKDCVNAGVSGFIIPDMPLEETVEFRKVLEPAGLAIITLVGPNTSEERMREYAPYTKDYVYVVSVLGTTGGVNEHVEAISETLRRARRIFHTPLALGFGLREPSQLDVLPEDARPEAAVIGTALLRHLEAGKPAADFFRPWKQA